jgi:RHS repeat-associated protein
LIYPNGRVISYNSATGMDATLNRVTSISDTSATLASYTYLGLGTVVRITNPQPGVWLDLWGGTSGVFAGLDLFNRIIDQRWQNNITGTPTDIDRYKYGYDFNANRQYKANVVGTPIVTGGLDEYYTNDNLNRLTDMQRGVLNGTNTGITGTPSREMTYGLDLTGNWSTYVTQTSGTTDLNQGRTANPVNEITTITASGGTPVWVTPAYDLAGNMTTMPQPGTPTSSFTAAYDAWMRMTAIDASVSPVGQYQYDGRDRRIVSVTTQTRHFYFTDTWQDIEQRVGSATTMDQQHVWGVRYIDELVCRDDATPERLYVTQDANFNVTGVGDTSGTVQERFVYDPYGTITTLNGPWGATTESFNWANFQQGGYLDVATGLYTFRNRLYSPVLGLWLQRHPAGWSNLYRAFDGNPVSITDPLGLDPGPMGLAGPSPSGTVDYKGQPPPTAAPDPKPAPPATKPAPPTTAPTSGPTSGPTTQPTCHYRYTPAQYAKLKCGCSAGPFDIPDKKKYPCKVTSDVGRSAMVRMTGACTRNSNDPKIPCPVGDKCYLYLCYICQPRALGPEWVVDSLEDTCLPNPQAVSCAGDGTGLPDLA